MKINAEVYAYAHWNELKMLLDKDPGLKSHVDSELKNMTDRDMVKKCPSCRGCGGGCCENMQDDPSYPAAVLSSIFDYYMPDIVKNTLQMSVITYVDEPE